MWHTGDGKATEADSKCQTSDSRHSVCRVAYTEQEHRLHAETYHTPHT